MNRSLIAALLLGAATFGASAQALDVAAEHDALRKLKSDIEQAVSRRDFEAAGKAMHAPFMATVVTQDSFTDMASLKGYFDQLFTRDFLRLKNFTIKAEADELSQIMSGTFALTRGSTAERYEMADGRNFDMKGRWSAVSVKEADGSWKIVGIHMGINFLDNPVIAAIEKSVMWFGLGGLALGLGAGFAGGWFLRRARS